MHLYYYYYNNNNNATFFFTLSWLGYDIPLRCLQYFLLVFKLEVLYETPYSHLSFKLFSFVLNCYTVLYNVYKFTHQQNILYLHVITIDQTVLVGVVRYEYQFFLVWGGERGGSVVECRTPEREVRGSRPTAAVLCPWARHFTPRKYWLITQEAMAPSRHDWKIVDWDVKPQHNQPCLRSVH